MITARPLRGVLRLLCSALPLAAPLHSVYAQGRIPTPAEVLSLPIGADRTLADWPQILRYFDTLAQRSPSVKLDTIGTTTQGRPMIVAAISTPANIRRLDAILAAQKRLADPRRLSRVAEDSLVSASPVVLWINCNLHSTEIASSQMAMELAYQLATVDSLQQSLQNVVVALVPSANPDGMQMITEWYKQGLGTPFEGGAMPWLYHQYVGHDNNRDWYMVTQQETRVISSALYTKYFPQVFWDVHQQGSNGMRLTVPPHIDPINQNVDVRIVRGINLVGQRMAWALQQAGKTGVGDGVTYDLWWNGGARSTPTRHNMIGLLTEAASVRIATPITLKPEEVTANRGSLRNAPRVNYPSPWTGGTWRLRDIMDYELIAAQALVRMAAEMRGDLTRSMVQVARSQIEAGTGMQYVIDAKQHDPAAAYALVQVLRRGAVEVMGNDDAIRANGGSWTVSLEQPYAAHVRDLFEEQQWPASAGDRPYDVAGWTLPYQMGVTVRLEKTVTAPAVASGASCTLPRGANVTLDLRDSRAFPTTFAALKQGVRVDLHRSREAASVTVPTSFTKTFTPAGGWCGAATLASASGERTRLTTAPRVGLYKPWTASMDEGWTRWLFDTQGVPFTNVTDSVVKSGTLRARYDVLIIPDMSLREAKEGLVAAGAPAQYAGGLGAAGVKAIGDFVAAGGVMMTFDRGSELAMDAVPGLPVRRISPQSRAPARDGRARDDSTAAPAGANVVAPGSILRTLSAAGHRLTMGMPDTVPVYFTNSTAFDVAQDANVEVPLRYPAAATSLLMSGYLTGGELLAGKAAAVDITVGAGRVVMFGFRPQYRGQSWGTFKLVYNAILTSAERSKARALLP